MQIASEPKSSSTQDITAEAMAIRVNSLSKCYQIYDKPQDRLKQAILPKVQQAMAPLNKLFVRQERSNKPYYREFWAIRDVSFEVKKGETVGIIGRNGSGKSTLLQMIAGTLTPTSGSAEVKGRVAALLELGSGFDPEFTGRENVYLNGAILGLSHEEIERRFEAIADFADIGEFIGQPVKTYSSGMVVRLAFSVSVNVEPDILVIDEALSVGDAAFQFKCMERLERLTRSGVTLLFVSHDIGTVKAFCDRAIYLDQGMIKAAGKAEETAEIYLLDLKNAQKQTLSKGPPITLKPALGNEKGIAFGTEEGKVTKAVFTDTNSVCSAYRQGDRVEIRVDVEFKSSIKKPCVSIILQDRRMIGISGRYFRIDKEPDTDGLCRASAIFSFRAALQEGHYFITVRLEDRFLEEQFLLVDKQAGVLYFEVTRSGKKDFLGIVDMQMECTDLKYSDLSKAVLQSMRK
jgi:lipopolysaccharide transport system ATP-binding protein